MRRRIFCLCLVVALGCPLPLFADMAENIQHRYETLHSFRALFTQKLTNAATKKTQERFGSIAFAKPRLLRWETTSPEEELVMIGAKEVWEYLPEEGVAYHYSVEQIFQSKTMLRFLSGEAHFKEDFVVVEQGMEDGLYRLELTPREPEPSLTLARIWVRPEDHFLERVQIFDFFGNENLLILKGIEIDPSIPPQTFSFSPPQGVKVLPGKVQE